MKKNLPTDITNELAGSSVFFQRRQAAEAEQPKSDVEHVPVSKPNARQNDANTNIQPRHHATTVSRKIDTSNEAVPPSLQPSTTPSKDGTVDAAMLETMRKAVKQVGKEAATHRFTAEEKNAIADLVYTYSRQGVKTSENEITRIAVNWLLQDYREHGAGSMLARMLESLHG